MSKQHVLQENLTLSVKRKTAGRKKIVSNPNVCCRLCKKSLKIEYGPYSCYVDIFKVLERKDAPSKAIAIYLQQMGIQIRKSPLQSQVLYMPCGRKMWKLIELFSFTFSLFEEDTENMTCGSQEGLNTLSNADKRKSNLILSPG